MAIGGDGSCRRACFEARRVVWIMLLLRIPHVASEALRETDFEGIKMPFRKHTLHGISGPQR